MGAESPDFARDGAGEFEAGPVFPASTPPADEPVEEAPIANPVQELVEASPLADAVPAAPTAAISDVVGDVAGTDAGGGARFLPASSEREVPLPRSGLAILAVTLGLGASIGALRSRRQPATG